MSALVQEALYDGTGMWSDTRGPIEQTWRIPAEDGLVGRSHVRIDGSVPNAGVVPGIARDGGAAVKHFDGRRRQPTIDFLAGKAVGYRVETPTILSRDHLAFAMRASASSPRMPRLSRAVRQDK